MTLSQARALKAGDMIHHVSKKNADGSPMRARVTFVKIWKTRPTDIIISVKHGMYDFAKFSETELAQIEPGDGRDLT